MHKPHDGLWTLKWRSDDSRKGKRTLSHRVHEVKVGTLVNEHLRQPREPLTNCTHQRGSVPKTLQRTAGEHTLDIVEIR